MKHFRSHLQQGLGIGLVVILSALVVCAQQSRGTLRGSVKDELGASIVGATITIIDASGTTKTAVTNGDGIYTLGGLAPGKYSVVAAALRICAIGTDRSRSSSRPTAIFGYYADRSRLKIKR